MRQADSRRLDRLAGDGNSEAGINLASLFRVILDQVQDSADGVSPEVLMGPVQANVSNHARVEHWYREKLPGADPWKALVADALDQLANRGLLAGDGDRWKATLKLVTGKRLIVVPERKGKHGPVGVIVHGAAEREALAETEKRRMEVTSLAASLREDGPGLRPLDQDHVAVLEQSMRDYGYRPEFPVLVDRKARILDGRHRIAAAKRAGVDVPPYRPVPIDSDEEAVGFAILVNLQRGWATAERKRINADLRAAGLTMENFGSQLGPAAKRELVAATLIEHPDSSHRQIAQILKMDHGRGREFVVKVCAEVASRGNFSCTHGNVGQGTRNDLAKGASSGNRKADSPELLDRHEQLDETVNRLREQGMTQHEIATATAVTFNQVQDSYQRLEGEQRAKRKASPPTAQPRQPTVPPANNVGADAEVLAQMVTLGRLLTAKTKRQLVAGWLREMSDEERAEILKEIG